jgi:hypothetical protein
MAKKDTTKLRDLLKRRNSTRSIDELELLEMLIDKEIDRIKLKRNYDFRKGGMVISTVDNRKKK